MKALGPSEVICIVFQGKRWAHLIASALGIGSMFGPIQYYYDTGLCLPGFSGLKGSVSDGKPAPISPSALDVSELRALMVVTVIDC